MLAEKILPHWVMSPASDLSLKACIFKAFVYVCRDVRSAYYPLCSSHLVLIPFVFLDSFTSSMPYVYDFIDLQKA